ncbi:DNA-binding protein [Stutzerimonas stutzeri]|uniref:DNA-binding protein n=1 Tax=Stutzerimonas stutzeri TaxID=316 RepID=UPI002109BF28|nr:DNA-binding protein [Stutzerimonas stutzeri]MCQ4242382.1 Mu transposase C-terminal domain-containing protein [Stutzerimonas stutzeri]
MPIRDWYTAKELAGLPGLPGTAFGVRKLADRQGWEGQRRLGSKAIEYSVALLPKEALNALLVTQLSTPPTPFEAPEPVSARYVYNERDGVSASRLNDHQRSVMTARLSIIREIERMSQAVTQQRAILTLVGMARDGQLSQYLAERVERANDRKSPDRTLSERTLKRWLADYRKHGEIGLAPARRKANMGVPDWAAEFLKHYQRPQKPSVEAAYAFFAQDQAGDCPSIHQVRRFLKKLSPQAREQGRMSAQELKSLKAYHRLGSDHLLPNDVWVADGHTFDAEVLDPRTNKPFRPEITTCLDWHTRRVVGYAINLAESALATLDMLTSGIARCGMFREFYVDNGSGFDNAQVREVIDRLGGGMTNALPYNSQARGVIERSHRTILVRLAKEFDSYIGADMDKQAGTRAFRISRKALKGGEAPKQMPTLFDFWTRLAVALDAYNDQPHRGLPKARDPQTGRVRHQTPNEAWTAALADGFEPITAPLDLVTSLTRPQELRYVDRGQVRINSGVYFLKDLDLLHGQQVRVAWDYRDAQRVGIYTLDGEHIGEAELDGNVRKVFTKLERKDDTRIKGQLARLGTKGETLTGEKVEVRILPRNTAPQYTDEQLADARQHAALQIEQQPTFQLPGDSVARYRLWKQLDARLRDGGEPLTEHEARWHDHYPSRSEYTSMRDLFDADPSQQARA